MNLISRQQAAKILGIEVNSFGYYIRNGLIEVYPQKGYDSNYKGFVNKEDVKKLKKNKKPRKRKSSKRTLSLFPQPRKIRNEDKYGVGKYYYYIDKSVAGKRTKRIFSVDKYGEANARLLASIQRLKWLIQEGAWKIEYGDSMEEIGKVLVDYRESGR